MISLMSRDGGLVAHEDATKEPQGPFWRTNLYSGGSMEGAEPRVRTVICACAGIVDVVAIALGRHLEAIFGES